MNTRIVWYALGVSLLANFVLVGTVAWHYGIGPAIDDAAAEERSRLQVEKATANLEVEHARKVEALQSDLSLAHRGLDEAERQLTENRETLAAAQRALDAFQAERDAAMLQVEADDDDENRRQMALQDLRRRAKTIGRDISSTEDDIVLFNKQLSRWQDQVTRLEREPQDEYTRERLRESRDAVASYSGELDSARERLRDLREMQRQLQKQIQHIETYGTLPNDP